jgi:Tfp pilus assembly protein PilV
MSSDALSPTRRAAGRLFPPAPVARAARSQGFTAIEVLIAMTLMIVGAAAVMSMQKASIQGNLDARKTDLANSIARIWVERLQRDAMQWTPTTVSAQNPGGTNLTLAKLLTHAGGGWFLPSDYMGSSPETSSFAFDILGRDLASADIAASAIFCVNVRETWLVQNQLLRADVRVLWPRAINSAPAQFCSVALPDQPEAVVGAPIYHAIYTTTAVGMNPGAP